MHNGKQTIRAGVDIGGTFTDVALEYGDRLYSAKVLTDYEKPERAIVEGLRRAAAQASIEPAQIGAIVHGTTLATNALIERRGARTAFITSEGFRDVIEMRTESRFEQYDLGIALPKPLVPRCDRFAVGGRMDAQGNELVPLDLDGLKQIIAAIRAAEFPSVAVGLLHSYRNPTHERAVRECLRQHLPGVAISLSSEVSPQIREYERFNTVCANAYVKPLMSSYLNRLATALESEGMHCPLYMIHSGGGLMSLKSAAEFPVRLLESGPAGGAIYASHVAARFGLDKVLSFDMGGTTAKICLIEALPLNRSLMFCDQVCFAPIWMTYAYCTGRLCREGGRNGTVPCLRDVDRKSFNSPPARKTPVLRSGCFWYAKIADNTLRPLPMHLLRLLDEAEHVRWITGRPLVGMRVERSCPASS